MSIRLCFALIIALTLLPACNKNKGEGSLPKLHPVKGVVTRNGTPVQGGGLFIRSEKDNPNIMVSAIVESDGKFEIATMDTQDKEGKKHPGAPEGSYQITYAPPGQDQSVTPVVLTRPFVVEARTNEWPIELIDGK